MTTQEQHNLGLLEQSLFFNKERMLRWVWSVQGSKGSHPELEQYEQRQQAKLSLTQRIVRGLLGLKIKA